MKTEVKDPLYAKYLARFTSFFPNFDFSFIKPVRKKAVRLLNLKEGNRVIDAGCGSGGSFPFLLEAVGDTGEIVGVEISPATTINTRKRIAANNWKNIRIIEGNAQNVGLEGKFDGLLMFAAPDVFASEKALSNILPHLKENARVAFFGAKMSSGKLGWLLNGLLRFAITKLSFESTPLPNDKPWRLIENRSENMEIEEFFFGSMFLASGTLNSTASKKLE
jgi:SAM-dependent methyltransferase